MSDYKQIEDLAVITSAPKFLVVDYTDRLKRHRNWPRGESNRSAYYDRKPGQDIREIVVHHTAGQTKAPSEGIERTNQYIIHERGWPSIPYHLYVPFNPVTINDRPVIYQLHPFERRTWHTYGGNTHSVGVVFQGFFGPDSPPSRMQMALFDPVIRWTLMVNGLGDRAVRGHFDYTKRECPGPQLEYLIRGMRGEKLPDYRDWIGQWPMV